MPSSPNDVDTIAEYQAYLYEYSLNAAWQSDESANSTSPSAHSIVLIDSGTLTGILKTYLDFIFMNQGRLLCSPFCPRFSTVL